MSNQPAISKSEVQVKEETNGEVDLLSRILDEGKLDRDDHQTARGKDMLTEFVQQSSTGRSCRQRIWKRPSNARIAQIDKLISTQLNEIMHHQEFQRLEGSWRGLHHLVSSSETSTMLKIRLLNVSKKELTRDLEKAAEFDQSALFKKVYEEEFGMFGGSPFGAMIGDFEFTNHPDDISLLTKISNVAAAAHAPFISAASPRLLDGTVLTSSAKSGIWRRYSSELNTQNIVHSGIQRIRAMSVCACRTH